MAACIRNAGPRTARRRAEAGDGEFRCSFCAKEAEQVRKLIAGPSVSICDECVEVCVGLLHDETGRGNVADASPVSSNASTWRGTTPAGFCPLCRMPLKMTEAVLIDGKGVLCRPCVAEVRVAAGDPAPRRRS